MIVSMLLFITALILNLYYLNAGVFHYDGLIVLESIQQNSFPVFLHLRTTYFFLAFILSKILPFSIETTINLVSAFSGAACISVLYLLLKKYFNKNISALASTLLMLNPLFLSISTYGKEHTFETLLFLLTLLFISKKQIWKATTTIILYIFTRETSIFLLPAIFIFAYKNLDWTNPKTKKCIAIIFFAFSVYTYFALYPAYFKQVIEANHPVQNFHAWNSNTIIQALKDIQQTLHWPMLLLITLGIITLLMLKQYFWIIFTGSWLLPTYILINHSLYSFRWLTIIMPAMSLLSAFGINALWKKAYKILPIALVILFSTSTLAMMHPILSYRQEAGGMKVLEEAFRDSDKNSYVGIYGDHCIFVKQYTKAKCFPNDPTNQTIQFIKEKLKENSTVYLFLNFDQNQKKQVPMFQKQLQENFKGERLPDIIGEDFHDAEISLKKKNWVLYKIVCSLEYKNCI
ncbi:glycosyltransferase family 39 protein [Candidatus Woesearchaeota archaeon]|nr:glycosyltransferase family 39 protein [Candidatus Woesearchaeota archaeon]